MTKKTLKNATVKRPKAPLKGKVIRNVAKMILVSVVLFNTACAVTPTGKFVQARESLTSITESVTFLAEQKVLDDQQIVAVDKVIQVARAALVAAEKKLPDGGDSFSDYLDIVMAAVFKLNEQYNLGKKKVRE